MKHKSLQTSSSMLTRVLNAAFLIVILVVGASGQTEGSTRTDSSTPLGLSPGSPAGSYSLSDFETVNPFNGGLNFRLPLLNIGGRGGTGYSLPLHIEQKWSISREVVPHSGAFYHGHSGWWSEDFGTARTLNVGRLQVRRGGSENFLGPDCADYRYTKTVTRITFTAPDGTEYELRDQKTGGQPAEPAPCSTGFNRERVFVTADGTSATYISDADIIDAYSFSEAGEDPFRNSGDLMLRDGTHFRIVNGNVSWMRDRNGNKVSFAYELVLQRLVGITDSLNRQVTIAYDQTSGGEYYDLVTFTGYGGAARTIKIGHCLRSQAMRSDLTMPSQLFPGVTVENNNPPVINFIELPDGRRYQIQYNAYAEIARVILPTGGAIEYDWANGLTNGDASGIFDSVPPRDKYVYRRVVERRLYADGGSGTAYDSRMTYSRPETTTTNAGYVEVNQYNSSGGLLGRSRHYFLGSPRASFLQKATDYPAWQDSKEYRTEIFDPNALTTPIRIVENTFNQRAPVSWWTGVASAAPPNDVRLIETITTLADISPYQVSKKAFGYDDSVPFNNQNNVKEYDFGNGSAGSLVRETRTTFVTGATYTGSGVHLRNLPSDVSIYNGSNQLRAQTVFEYDNYSTADAFHALIKTYPPVGASHTPSGFEPSFNSTTNNLIRGNVTKTTRNLLDASGSVIGATNSYSQYDVLGNVVKAIDPRSTSSNLIATTFDYADNFGVPDNEARTNSGAPELNSLGLFTYAAPSMATNALGHTTYTQYDYYLGKAVNFEDANGVIGSGSYDDLLDRPKLVRRAIGTTAQNHTTFNYNDTDRVITTTSDQVAVDDGKLVSKLLYDKMGRTIETQQFEGGTNYIAVQTQYDSLGRAFKTSNPFRPWQSETPIWTTSAYDALGRIKTVTTPDSALVTTNYAGNTITVIDQAGKTRKSVSDALGRLTSVYEAPDNPSYNYLTSYTYDTLDNLTLVSQGSQTRTFAYDSLKRLKSAINPESGTVCYGTVAAGVCQANGYDANGNLLYKTDARGVQASYIYDALNRNTSVTYSNDPAGTLPIHRYYDGWRDGVFTNIPNVKGRLWQSETTGANGSLTTTNSFDALGRTLSQSQKFYAGSAWSQPFTTQRSYNLAGGVTSQNYPSGRVVTYAYDAAGRTSGFSGNLGGSQRDYATEILYSPRGGMTKEKFGTDTAIYNKLFYNSRGQLSEIRESTSYTGPTDTTWNRGAIINHYSMGCWGMCGGSTSTTSMTDNNGNLHKQEVYIPHNEQLQDAPFTTWYQQYDYDPLNRLQRVHEFTGNSSLDWQQEYLYDPFGNRRINQDPAKTYGTGINKKDFTVNTANNRLGVPVGQNGTMTYDAAGNLTTDTYSAAAVTRVYDAENRMTSETQASSYLAGSYVYNADGQRVRRTVGGQPSAVTTWQVYGMDGELLAEYAASALPASPKKEYGYRNGQLLITADAPTRTNVALASNGGTASASSYLGAPNNNYPSYVNDGARTTGPTGAAGWMDNTLGSFPDSVQVDFSGTKTISEIDVVTQQDTYQNPIEPTLTQTFSLYGITAFDVQYWTGSAWATVPNGSVTGNNKVWRQFTFSPITTSKIRVVVNAGADNAFSRVVEVEAWDPAPTSNVARASNGGTASASSYLGAPNNNYPSYVNDGARTAGAGGTAGWLDNTFGNFPDWVQVDFSGTKTISEIDVVTQQDTYQNPIEPTLTQTFSLYGITAFDVQYWTGSAWATVPNGSVTGNNKVWRQFTFSPITTSKIRVVVNAGADNAYCRVVEVEAWAETASTSKTNWLVTDQLGTPRMVFDQTGAFAATKRHDYLPFGEDIPGYVGVRNSNNNNLGYATSDTVRQKFTQKERDNESGLDYFGARYFSSQQGRFTSPDEYAGGPTELFAKVAAHNPTFYSDIAEPQSLNKYQYALNNPLRNIDPDGHQSTLADRVSGGASGSNSRFDRIKSGAAKVARTALATVNGAASAWSEDNGLGSTSGEQNRVGRGAGHVIALAQASAEILVGANVAVGGGAEAIITSPAVVTGVGTAAPAVGVAVVVGGVVVAGHGAAVGVNTLGNIFSKGKDGHPPKDTSTVQGATDQVDDITANQASQRKVGKPDAIQSTKGSEQELKTQLKKIKSQEDAPLE